MARLIGKDEVDLRPPLTFDGARMGTITDLSSIEFDHTFTNPAADACQTPHVTRGVAAIVSPDDQGTPIHEKTITSSTRKRLQQREKIRSPEIVLRQLRRGMCRMALQVQQFASDPESNRYLPACNSMSVTSSSFSVDNDEDDEQHSNSYSPSKDDPNVDLSSWLFEKDASTASAWSSLENAVSMLQEHARLATDEASVAQGSQVRAEAWRERAEHAEAKLQQVQEQAKLLSQQVHRLSTEKRVLVKEVKSIRERLEAAEQKDIWRQVENYVVRALSVHEAQLNKKNHSASVCSVGESDAPHFQQSLESSPDGMKVEHENDTTTVANTTVTEDDSKLETFGPVQVPEGEPAPMPPPIPPPLPTRSLGFGSGVALGFGRGFAMKPKENNSSTACNTSKPVNADPVGPKEQVQHATVAKPTALANDTPRHHNGVLRSRVNSAEQFGSSVKKFLQSGSNGIASAISGRTSPPQIATLETPSVARTNSHEGDSSADVVTTRPRDDSQDFSLVTAEDAPPLFGTFSSSSHHSPWIPNHIVATHTGVSRDIISQLGSPLLLTPSESPSSTGDSHNHMSTHVIELDCDPLILRSLSIPIADDRNHRYHPGHFSDIHNNTKNLSSITDGHSCDKKPQQ